jgi:hypothetical protein
MLRTKYRNKAIQNNANHGRKEKCTKDYKNIHSMYDVIVNNGEKRLIKTGVQCSGEYVIM